MLSPPSPPSLSKLAPVQPIRYARVHARAACAREVHICSRGFIYLHANLRSHLAGVELSLELVDMLEDLHVSAPGVTREHAVCAVHVLGGCACALHVCMCALCMRAQVQVFPSHMHACPDAAPA